MATGPRHAASVVYTHKEPDGWFLDEVHRSGGGWTAPERLGPAARKDYWKVHPYRAQVTIDGKGTTTVAWEDRDSQGFFVDRRAAGGDWGRARQLSSRGRLMLLDSSPRGQVIAVWICYRSKGHVLRASLNAAVRPEAGRWRDPVVLDRTSAPDYDNYVSFEVAADLGPTGRSLVTWEGYTDGATAGLRWATAGPRGRFGPGHTIKRNAYLWGLSANSKGAALALYSVEGRQGCQFETRHWRARGFWEPAHRLGGCGPDYESVWLDRAGVGHLLATRGRGGVVWRNERPDGAWSRPRELLTYRQWGWDGLAGDGNGRTFVLLYRTPDGTPYARVRQ